ncbi:MAG: LptF/LptG family permease, partial [Steroidobacteraceae bacterium]
MGKILGRYILREVITAWIVVMGVLLVILLANQVAAVLERAAASQFPQAVVFELIYLGMLQYLSILVPFGLLLGIVLALGRLYHDSELAAAFACGARPAMLYGGVIALGVVLAAGLAALTLFVAPGATEQALHIR